MIDTNDLHRLAGAYALDALDTGEHVAFERHLAGCAACRQEVREFTATAVLLGGALAVAPGAPHRDSVLAAVATERQTAPALPDPVVDLAGRHRRRAPRTRLLAAAAAAVVAVVALFAATRLTSDPVDPVADLVAAPDAVVAELRGDDVAGVVRVIWSPGRDQAAVVGSDVGDVDDGQAYALWAQRGDSVAAAGLFVPEDGSVRQVIDLDGSDPTGWAVTIEPDTGSEQPTGDVVYSSL